VRRPCVAPAWSARTSLLGQIERRRYAPQMSSGGLRAATRVALIRLGVTALVSFSSFGCSREETQGGGGAAPSTPPQPASATAPPPALLDLGVGTKFLVYRDAEARVFVQRLGYPEAQRFDFSGLGAEAPAQISGLALAPDDSVLAMSFKTADGRARSALLDV